MRSSRFLPQTSFVNRIRKKEEEEEAAGKNQTNLHAQNLFCSPLIHRENDL